MNTLKHPVKILFSRGAMIFIAVLFAATVAPQILNIRPVSADNGGYPWSDTHALYASPDYTSSYGYATPCPSKDTECDKGGSSLIGTVGGITYGESDTWHYGLRNCTSYAAWKINQVFNVSNISGWGNGYQWDTGYINPQPYPVHNSSGYTPQVGDIAQWESHTGDSFGHVAYVWKVESNGVADLYEYNQAYDGNFTGTRSTASGSDGTPDHYIHIGNTTSSAASKPSALQFGSEMDVYKRGSDNAIWKDTWNSPTWSGWSSLGGGLSSDPIAIKYNSEMDVFAIASNGQVVKDTWNGTSWSNWNSLGGNMAGSLAAIQYGSSEMDVFARSASDGHIYKDTWNGSSWSGFNSLGGNMAGNPAVVKYGSEMDVYARGSDGAIWKNTWNGSSWSGFNGLGGGLTGDPMAIQYNSEMDVFATSTNGQIVKDTWNGSSWSNWNSLGGNMGSPTAIQFSSSEMDVYARGTTDSYIYKDTWNGTSWSGFNSLGGNEATDPTAILYGSPEMDVYATNWAGNIDKNTWNGSSWGGFSTLY